MNVSAESYRDERGIEKLRRIIIAGREIDVVENLDQWHGADHHYFKVMDQEGRIYILRRDDPHACWELTMYQRAPLEKLPSGSAGTGHPS